MLVLAGLALAMSIVTLCTTAGIAWYVGIVVPSRARRPDPEVWIYTTPQQGESMEHIAHVFGRNAGVGPAHDFRIRIPYVSGEKIIKVDAPEFTIVEGGKGEQFVTLNMSVVPARTQLPPIQVTAHSKPLWKEVSAWCVESTGRISFSPQ